MRTIVVAGLFVALGVPAFAADVSEPVAAPAWHHPWAQSAGPDFDWAGHYIGLNAGGAAGQFNWTYQLGPPSVNHTQAGVFGGVTAGFNLQKNQWVYGIEGDIDLAGINGSIACPNPSFSCQTSIGWFGTARGRLGVAVVGNLLLYGTGGVAFGSVTAQTTFPGGTVPTSGTPTNGTTIVNVGWTGGAGAELDIGNGFSVKGEWLYYDLGGSVYTVDNSLLVNGQAFGSLARVGINKRF